jgi:hypothetical protein
MNLAIGSISVVRRHPTLDFVLPATAASALCSVVMNIGLSLRSRHHRSPTAAILLGLVVAGACFRTPAPLPPVEITEIETGVPGPVSSGQVIRVGFLNTRMLPFSSAGSRASVIASRILAGDFAIVALSEVFSETGRERLVELLGAAFPYRVEFLGSGKLHRLDSGLMLLSRLPLSRIDGSVPFRPHHVRGRTELGADPEQVAQFVRFVEFDDCASMDCWAGKGAGYVRVDLEGRPLNLLFTHMQASYGSDDDRGRRRTVDARSSQRAQMASFIEAVAGNGLRRGENALLLGDLNVDVSAERLEMMSQLSAPFPYGLSDVWSDHAPEDDPGLTFPVRNPSVRFDYMLASRPDTASAFCVETISTTHGLNTRRPVGAGDISLERQVTDHLGLVVDLGLSGSRCSAPVLADADTTAGGSAARGAAEPYEPPARGN